jgi:hypothetical protein
VKILRQERALTVALDAAFGQLRREQVFISKGNSMKTFLGMRLTRQHVL